MQHDSDFKPNRLINEKSPYLLQHAYNPVDWYPWSQEALDSAKTQDKPIFLSIGYSTCHWCHVMETECFNDQQVADLLNHSFVCIKVDREERPDLDAQYMAVCQAMGRNCGWPLNVLLTPKLNPFFAQSYIPKFSRPGITGFVELVPQVNQIWKVQRQQLEIVGADIKDRIQAMENREPEGCLGLEVLQDACDRLYLDYDSENGGFGSAPKFPTPHKLIFLLHYYTKTRDPKYLAMVETTLNKMRQGGIYDQIGFGFHRYSTDPEWLVPHFEKMLYDQALMAIAYLEAFQTTRATRFAMAAKETLDYVLRDLVAKENSSTPIVGGFYSAQDADSEGEEGKFYVWTIDQIFDALSPADADLALHIFGLKQEGNFPGSSSTNILHIAESLEDLAPYKGMTLQELVERLHEIRKTLFETRKKRIPPATDTKVLTDWNGLAIAAFAKAGVILEEPKYLDQAKKTADFIISKMYEKNVIYHRYAKGETAIEGFLDDYAFTIYGLIELYEATLEQKYLKTANDLTKTMISNFWDQKNGGFYQTNKNETSLPQLKQIYDGAIPSGNSVAFWNLLRLGRLINEPNYETTATQLVKTFANEIEGSPDAFTFFLIGLDFMLGPSYSVTIVGDAKDPNTQEMMKLIKQNYLPRTLVSLKALDAGDLAFQQIDGKTTAYVCRDQTCLPPTNNLEKLKNQLELTSPK